MRLRLLLIITSLVFQCLSLNATHIIGGEIYYDCLGNNQFRVVLKLYRDCLLGQAPYDDPANVAVYNSQGALISNIEMVFPGSSLVPQGSINPCYQDEANLCVEEAIYEEIVTLPPTSGGYTLVYQRCCRNQSILNINDPGDTGATYMINIPESAFTDCNSSPRFNIFPPIVLCINDPLQFDHSATDPDGDSLVYSFCDPFEGATPDDPMPIPPGPPPYNFVNFIAPFSANNPLPSNPIPSVDPSSGQLTGFPTQIGQYVVAVCVSEYRDGILLSTNKRDFQFNVVNCSGESTASFEAPTAEINIDGSVFCNGLSVNFIDQSENALFYLWDFGVPGINTDISTAQNPVYVYPDTGRYIATLIVNPGYSCADTTFLQVGVYAELVADINGIDGQCIINNSFSFGAEGDFDADASFFWEFPGPSSYSSSSQMNPPAVSYSEAGSFEAYLSITTTHCMAFDTIEVIVYPELQIDLDISDADACVPASIEFDNLSPDSPGAIYLWNFGDGNTSNQYAPVHFYEEPGIYDIQLSVEHVIGCVGTVSETFPQYIRIRPRPDAGIDAEPSEVDILDPTVVLYDISSGQISSWINPGTGEEFFESSIEFVYSDTGNYTAMVVALNSEGCYDTASVIVRVNPVFNVYIPNAFSPNGDGINEVFIAKGEGFVEFSMAIFDRWGDEIFTSKSEEVPWDGRANRGSEIAQSGVYNYKFWITDVFNTEHVFTGRVLLIR